LILIGFLLFGGLLENYPFGVDAIRFILPFSIISLCFIGLSLSELKISNKKYFLVFIFTLLLIGLIWNTFVIKENLDKFSYYKEDSRYGIFQDIIKNSYFPIKNEFTNYRFGTSKFVFGETLNYFMPKLSQTLGYQDIGMLNAPKYYDMRWNIYTSENVNDSIYWLDWFAIKYFESEGLTSNSTRKFENDFRFKQVMNYSGNYEFVLFEYLNAKQIISLVDYANKTSFGSEKQFQWERESPDKVIIRYDSIDKDDIILFKEFYHQTWKAKDLISGKELKITKVDPGFMAVYPEQSSKGVIFYQSKIIWDTFGILLTLLGIFLLIKFKIQ
jgi:hypothetical protein